MSTRQLRVFPDALRVEQALLRASSVEGFVDADGFCTLRKLIELCEPYRFGRCAPAPRLVQQLLVARHLRTLASPTFGPAARTAAFASAVVELLAHLKTMGATRELLVRAAHRVGGALEERALALAKIWEEMDFELARDGLTDLDDALALATQRLEALGLSDPLQRFHTIRLEHIHDLFPRRLRFIEALATACQRARRRLVVQHPLAGEPAADVFLAPALRFIEARWQTLDVEVLSEAPQAPLVGLAARAFAREPRPETEPPLRYFNAATPNEELREIARRVKRLAREGVPPERIAVVLPDLRKDVEVLTEALEEYGLPARVRRESPLASTPVGRMAALLLSIADSEFKAPDVAALLTSSHVGELSDGGLGPWRWIAEAGVRDDTLGATGGRGAWLVRLAALEARLKAPADQQEVRRLAERVHILKKLATSIPSRGQALEMLEAWWKAMGVLGLQGGEQRREGAFGDRESRHPELERALARNQAASTALGELRSTLIQALTRAHATDWVLERSELAGWVEAAAAEMNVASAGPRAGAVWLLPARQLAGCEFDHVFLGGLVDGRFPRRPEPSRVLSDEERNRLNREAAGDWPLFQLTVRDGELDLPVGEAEDRLLLHLCLSAAQRSVTVSRARRDSRGRELLASPFLDALARATGDDSTEEDRSRAMPRMGIAPLEAVESEGELRLAAALEALSEPASRVTERDSRAPALAAALRGETWFQDAGQQATAEAERLRFFTDATRPPGPYSGAIRDNALLAALQFQLDYPKGNPASAAELGDWGNCGFSGLLSRVLGLRVARAAGEDLDPRDRGSLLHDVLRRLVPALHSAGLLADLGRHPEHLDELIRDAVSRAAAALESRTWVGHPTVWQHGQARARNVVHRFVTSEAVTRGDGLAPAEAERSFGRPADSPPWAEVVLPPVFPGERPVYLSGKIDRVDVGPHRAAVIDYKAGSAASVFRAAGLLQADFQLPIYLLAARTAFPGKTLAGWWVGIRGRDARRLGDDHLVDQLLGTDEARRAATRDLSPPVNLANAVHALLARRRAGDFGARPHSCEFCAFRPACRISARRLEDF